jgi:hypothetical protein
MADKLMCLFISEEKNRMATPLTLDTRITRHVNRLTDHHKREVLRFIEYLKTREDGSFLAYVNERTQQALVAKQRGEHFTSLAELQQEYAQTLSTGTSTRR